MKFRVRYIFIGILVLGYLQETPLLQVVALLLYGASILTDDFRGWIVRRMDISTTFSIMLCLTSFSHFAALSSWVDSGNSWATYLVPEFMEKGLFVFGLGSCVIMETLRSSLSKKTQFVFAYYNPKVFTWILILSVLILIGNHLRIIPALGTISSFIELIINGSIFLLAYIAHTTNRTFRIIVVACYAMVLSLYAIQFSHLRMEIVIPWLAYYLGEILARKRLKNLHLISIVILFMGLIIYPLIFAYLGQNRSALSGRAEKLERVLEEGTQFEEVEGNETLLGRLNVLGQLSNIVSLTERKGFYDGFTLSYLSFVFIPRFLWPEKPRLDGGQWFAVEMGRSRYLPTGKATSSVNMTVPGEMYLNYGFIGLIIGCILFGFFVGYIWKLISGTDLLSWTFRFYLLFLGMFSLGSDLMIVPQLVAYILIYKGATLIKKNMYA